MSTPSISAAPLRLVRHEEGETHPVMGDPMRFIMTAAHSGGGYAFSEVEVVPGNGAPPHIHHHEEEAFYILDGSFEVIAGEEVHRVGKGDFVHVPRGMVRGFRNVSETAGRLLVLHCPGSAAGFYIGMGKLPAPPDLADIKALGDQFGIELVMP